MEYIDIHAHLEFFEKLSELDKVIENAKKARVEKILACGTNIETNRKALDYGKKYPETIEVCLGVYPTETVKLSDEQFDSELEFIEKNKEKIVAVGEIGLDLKESNNLKKQEKRFRDLLELAKKINKPVVIHSRKAEQRAIEILEEVVGKNNKVLMHCFCGKKKLVKRIISNSWSLSIPGNVKFSSQFQEMVELAPLEQLFCETDTPFLHPDKKFPNEPSNVIESYKKIAEIKKLSLDEVEKQIKKNYERLFHNSIY